MTFDRTFALFLGFGILVMVGTIAFGELIARPHRELADREARARCIERGGTITERSQNIGDWACWGLKR
jgi:hypothetical protein